MKNYVPLCLALIDALLVLETSAPTEIDSDIAVRGMENMSSSLLMLDDDDQLELRRALNNIAQESADLVYRKFVESVPDMMGLAS